MAISYLRRPEFDTREVTNQQAGGIAAGAVLRDVLREPLAGRLRCGRATDTTCQGAAFKGSSSIFVVPFH